MLHVLVAEDCPEDLELYSTHLKAAGFTVTSVETGEDALRAAFSRPAPDAVLLDLVLGRANGLEIVQSLRADPRTASLPIVAITAAVPKYAPDVAFAVGCSAFLAKPCLPNVVADTIRAVISDRAMAKAMTKAPPVAGQPLARVREPLGGGGQVGRRRRRAKPDPS